MPGGLTAQSRRNFLLLPAVLGLWVAFILARLIYLEVFQYVPLTRQARRQQERTVEVSPVRGVIYDRNLHPLAMSVEVDSVFAVPGEIPNAAATAKLLAPVLDMGAGEVRRRLQGTRFFSWVKRKISAREAARIRQLNLHGIYFQKESKRFYPKRELAAHVLGHVGLDDQGLAGIELRYDEAIRGRPGQLLIERDARQRWFRRAGRPPEAGENVVLTLDENIQYIAEKELAAAVAQSRALSGTVVIQDPHSGEILALANEPTFNPNTYGETNPERLRNLAISAAYEPGSTFKIVTLAAALEEKLADPEERVDCQMGAIWLAGHVIHDHKPFGILSVGEILQYSSDVGAIKVALRVGNAGMYRYLRSFGFGVPTGIELPGEAFGLTKPPERWSKISIGAIAMGQEIGVTPLQLATAVSAVANGGRWVRPHIVQQGNASQDRSPAGEARDTRRILSEDTAAILHRMMVQVVNAGTGKAGHPGGYTAGGKTGTAQKIDPATGAYSRTDHVASFIGFTPADSPMFTILVVLDSPRGRYHGGDVAAPVFKRIAEQVLAYRNVPANAPVKPLLALASWTEPASAPIAEMAVEADPAGLLSLDSGEPVPSFLGKTVRAVTEQALAEKLAVQVIGSGIAYAQSPRPGSPVREGEKVTVWFRMGEAARGPQPPTTKPSPKPPAAAPAQRLPDFVRAAG